MKLTKRSLVMIVAIVLCATMAIGSTLAFLTDTTDTVENTMVLGNVSIEQNETDANGNAFKQDQPLLPAVGDNNKITKHVSITNTGRNDAYVRNIVAFEMGNMSVAEFEQYVKYNFNTSDWTVSGGEQTTIDGKNYYVVTATYQTMLKAGETTSNSLDQVWLASSADNAQVEQLNADGNGLYSILAYSQAIQADGFADVNAAMNALQAADFDIGDVDTTTLAIGSADELFAFAKAVNNGNTYEGKLVKLVADIDLKGKDWTPIGSVNSYPSITFAGTFDGQGHTISNFKANAEGDGGLAAAGFFGSITGEVKNLTIENATITSTHYAGGIVGFSSANVGMEISNCHVKNSTITSKTEQINGSWDNGDKVGGIIGYMVAGDVVKNCSVSNTSITGYRDLGGIVGYNAGSVTNCKVSDVTVVVDNSNNYKNYTNNAEYDAGTIIGEDHGTANNGNEESNVIVKYALSSQTDLNEAVAAGNTELFLTAGTYKLPNLSGKTVEIIGTKDVIIDTTQGVLESTTGADLTFKGVTVKFANANHRGFTHAAKVVYEDCTLEGQMTMYANTDFINCTFKSTGDWYAVWTYGCDANFTNCTFNTDGKAVLVYNEGVHNSDIKLTNCVFNDSKNGAIGKGAVETGYDNGQVPTITLTFNDCTVNGFAADTKGVVTNTPFYGNKNNIPDSNLSVTIDNVKVY